MSKQMLTPNKPATFTPANTGILQRKCACMGSDSLAGECAECRKKKIMGQKGLPLQTKLAISQPGDTYEREADHIADKIIRMPASQVDRKLRDNAGSASKPLLQRHGTSPTSRTDVPPVVQEVLNSPGQPLDNATRTYMEPCFGHDFSQVRVHTGARAEDATRSVQARAFTSGQNLVFAAGEYNPQSERGRNLLAHELTHTLQQTPSDRLQRKPLTPEEKQENLQSDFLKDDQRLQQAFDNSPLLKKNETSDGVKTLQRALKELGYPLPKSFAKTGDADGVFGDETYAQVKQFQRDNHLADDGIVGRDTLRVLDGKFNPKVTIEKVYFGQDRRELINNEVDWSAAGTKYVDWADAPYHIVFKPGELFGDAIPITMSAGQKIEAIAKVSVRGGIPGRTYSLKSSPMGQMPGWKLSGEGTHREGFDTDYIFLSSEAPLDNKIAFQDFLMLWESQTFANRMPGAISAQKVFVTSGAAHNTAETNGGDTPNSPTFRRLKEATTLAAGIPTNRADQIVRRVLARFPSYGVCDVPTKPNNYRITCPVLSSVWEMSDFAPGHFQCITISRYASAALNVLGVPKAEANITTKPVLIWADVAHKEEGIDSDYPQGGIPPTVHPYQPGWRLGLIDGRCGVNSFEACVKLQWTPPGQSQTVVQYYCGGVTNPPEGFKTPREVLNSAFVLAWFVHMARNDPESGFPRGIRMRDVQVYHESGSCYQELP